MTKIKLSTDPTQRRKLETINRRLNDAGVNSWSRKSRRRVSELLADLRLRHKSGGVCMDYVISKSIEYCPTYVPPDVNYFVYPYELVPDYTLERIKNSLQNRDFLYELRTEMFRFFNKHYSLLILQRVISNYENYVNNEQVEYKHITMDNWSDMQKLVSFIKRREKNRYVALSVLRITCDIHMSGVL